MMKRSRHIGGLMIGRRECLVQFAALLLAPLAGFAARAGGRPELRLCDERGRPLETESGEPIVG
jgi:hypothetical protein